MTDRIRSAKVPLALKNEARKAGEMPTAVRWAYLALTGARRKCGVEGWRLLSAEVRHAMICQELIGIFATQESTTFEKMRDACDAVLDMAHRECEVSS